MIRPRTAAATKQTSVISSAVAPGSQAPGLPGAAGVGVDAVRAAGGRGDGEPHELVPVSDLPPTSLVLAWRRSDRNPLIADYADALCSLPG